MQSPTNHQKLFVETLLGTLLYSVVLGLFNDYTTLVYIKSYSILLLAALVLQILTHLTFMLKDHVVRRFRGRTGKYDKLALGFSIWLIMFLSKFPFLLAIEFIFGGTVVIRDFVGLMLVIVSMTAAKTVIDIVYKRLGEQK